MTMAYDPTDALARAAKIEAGRAERRLAAQQADRTWYILQVGGVQRAIEFLKREGFESWYPMMRISRPVPLRKLSQAQRKHAGLFRTFTVEPLFRNYLFVRLDLLTDHWRDIFREAGVYGIACKGDMPCVLLQSDIDRIKHQEQDGFIPGSTRLEDLFKVGERVRVTDGVFTGHPATIDQVDESGRFRLLVDIFGRSTPAEFELDQFEKL